MRVRVLYFGLLKEWFGTMEQELDVPEGTTVRDLLRILGDQTSNVTMDTRIWQSIAVAVNREYSSPAAPLTDGDEIALLPPVSGGSYGPARTAAGSLPLAVVGLPAGAHAMLANEMSPERVKGWGDAD